MKTAASLRLSIDDQPELRQARVLRRAALGGADFVVALAIAWLSTFVVDSSVWIPVTLALAYHALGRVMTDEPLTAWIVGRLRSVPPAADADLAEDVAVNDVARTTA